MSSPSRFATIGLAFASLITIAAACAAPPRSGGGGDVAATAAALEATSQAVRPTAQALPSQISTAQAIVTQVSTASALLTEAAPTVAALSTQAAQVTPINATDASAAVSAYAEMVLGATFTIVRAGGASSEIERLLQASPSGTAAQSSVAQVAMQTYLAVLAGGVGSVSYGNGEVAGDLNMDINASSLGVFSLEARQPMYVTEEEALAAVWHTFPALSDRAYTRQATTKGYAWLAEGQAQGFDIKTRQATLIAERVIIGVMPAGPRQTVVYAIVGKGDFAANVQP